MCWAQPARDASTLRTLSACAGATSTHATDRLGPILWCQVPAAGAHVGDGKELGRAIAVINAVRTLPPELAKGVQGRVNVLLS